MADFNLGNNQENNNWEQNQDYNDWGQDQVDDGWDQNQSQDCNNWEQNQDYNGWGQDQGNQYANQWNQYQVGNSRSGPSKKVIIGGILGGILGILVIIGIIGNIIGPPEKDNIQPNQEVNQNSNEMQTNAEEILENNGENQIEDKDQQDISNEQFDEGAQVNDENSQMTDENVQSDKLDEHIEKEDGFDVIIDADEVNSEEIDTIQLEDYTIGDTITVHTSKGDFSITFNSVEETSDRNLQSDFSPMRVILLNYTVKNISYSDQFQVLPFNLKVTDYLGDEMQQYYLNTDYGDPINIGESGDITVAYGLNSAENKITIEYYTNTSWEESPRFTAVLSNWK